MATTITYIPFTEFEHNPAHVFHRVTDERVTIVIEDETGKKVMLRPVEKIRSTRRKTKKVRVDYDALAAAAGSWQDVDADALVKQIYASRTITTRPFIEL
jgi:putative intracellular protease/amidase